MRRGRTIYSHRTGKKIATFKSVAAAKAALKRMKRYSKRKGR